MAMPMQTIKELRRELERNKGERRQLQRNLIDSREKASLLRKEIKASEEAQTIIQEVAKQTQDEIGFQISELVVLSMATVFKDPYGFEISFVRRRGKTECDFYFTRDGYQFSPMRRSGGGTKDVASFALRATWVEETLILDEPFKFVDKDARPRASALLKELSKSLGIQIIMITHDKVLMMSADKVFITSKMGKVSRIRPLNKNQKIKLLRSIG